MSAGNAIVDGIAASAYTTLEEYGVVLDAMASQRFEHSVRARSACVDSQPRALETLSPGQCPCDVCSTL